MATLDSREPTASELNFFERPEGGEKAVLVHMDSPVQTVDEAVGELVALAESAGADVVDTLVVRRQRPDSRTFIGRGRVEQLAAMVAAGQADLVLLNHILSPSQERNLEQLVGCRVLDRTGLILDIFAQRARTHEGKLQVELAQLRHMSTRLVRGWSHLERQKGGIGLRGPGETQLELDRRMLGVRIRQLERQLGRVRKQREQGRQARRRRELSTVSLVGYTNAGKSTLFNKLTEAGVYADNRLFATLDTTLRKLDVGDAEPVILADTVGFIRDLPHHLVAAFRSTLEESAESQLLLHVIDAADVNWRESVRQVEGVLEEIGAAELPRIRVFNKIDEAGLPPGRAYDADTGIEEVRVSAVTGQGLEQLVEAIRERTASERVHGTVRLAPAEGRLRSRLFELGDVLREGMADNGDVLLEVNVRRRDLDRLYRKEGLRAALQPPVPH